MSRAILTNKKRSDWASLQIHSKLPGVNIESKGTCPDRVISAGCLLCFLAGGAAGGGGRGEPVSAGAGGGGGGILMA